MMKRMFCVTAALIAAAGMSISASASEKLWNASDFVSKKDLAQWKMAVVPQYGPAAWWVRGNEGTKKFAEDTGLNAFEASPTVADVANQIQVVEDLIAQGVDAICICPIDPAAMDMVFAEALDAGVVVITHEGGTTVQNCLYDVEAFLGEEYGAMMMDLLAEDMGETGLYATMVGNVTKASHNEWVTGGVNEQKAKYADMTLLGDEYPNVESGSSYEGAYNAAKELLTANPDLKGILTCDSLDPIGVSQALEELGLAGQVSLVGTGMPNECSGYLKSGTVTASCVWDPACATYAMLSLAEKILSGEEITDGVDLGSEGWDEMHFIEGSDTVLAGQGWIVLTADNVDEYNF